MKKLLLTLFCFISSYITLFAWGGKGHVLISHIARAQLSKSTIKTVNYYLNGLSWEDAACWMDDVKGDSELDYMKEWHYVNVAKDKTYVKTKNPNLINKLEYYLTVLKNRKNATKQAVNFALKIVFHLVGDMAQPLHCAYAQDKGGTYVHVTMQNHSTNLHKVWDSEIIENLKITNEVCNKTLLALTPSEIAACKNTDLIYWFNDSRAQLASVYGFNNNQLDDSYLKKNTSLITKQLVKGGLRLAAVLNQYFKD
ncbi:MAG: S1/P1 nuclease [Bacteroidia bacterium]|nr:S1/P1 nuclease [Bacteroidia bacterium]